MATYQITSRILENIQNTETNAAYRKQAVIDTLENQNGILKGIPGIISSVEYYMDYMEVINNPHFLITNIVGGKDDGDLIVEIESLNEALDLFIEDVGLENIFIGYAYSVCSNDKVIRVIGGYLKTRENIEWDDFVTEQNKLELKDKLRHAIDNPLPLNVDLITLGGLAATDGMYLIMDRKVYPMPYKDTDAPLKEVPLHLFSRGGTWVYLKPNEVGGFDFVKELEKLNEGKTQVQIL